MDIDKCVQRVLDGDIDQYSNIVAVYKESVTSVICGMIHQSFVQDVAQQTFIVAFKRLDSYKIGTNFKYWIHTIARNMAQNHRRVWYKAQIDLEDYKKEMLVKGDMIKPVEFPLLKKVLEALSCLEEPNKSIMNDFYLNGLGVDEIAKSKKMTNGNIKIRLHRSRKLITKEVLL